MELHGGFHGVPDDRGVLFPSGSPLNSSVVTEISLWEDGSYTRESECCPGGWCRLREHILHRDTKPVY